VAKREAPSEETSSPDVPSRNDARNDRVCGLCLKPLGFRPDARANRFTDGEGKDLVAHARCIHDRNLLERAVRRTNMQQTPSI
jgi:hypothetical protein